MINRKTIQAQIEKVRNSSESEDEVSQKKQSLQMLISWAYERGFVSKEDMDYLYTSVSSLNRNSEKSETPVKKSENSVHQHINQKFHKTDSLFNTVFSNKPLLAAIAGMGLVAVIISGFTYYRSKDSSANLQNQTQEQGRTLKFGGKLIEENGSIIDRKVDVRFRLYSLPTEGNVLYEGKCYGENGIVPDYRGTFQIEIGADCDMNVIPEKLFTEYQKLYLGITVGKNAEMSPRYPVATVSYAKNSDSVKGMTLGVNESTIPYIDQEGNLNIQAVSPSIKSSRGTFTLEGQTLLMKTLSEEPGNVIIDPQAGGTVVIPNGKVGIGTSTPLAELEISGDIAWNGDVLLQGPESSFYQTQGSNISFYTSQASKEFVYPAFTISSGGNVGVGIEIPNEKLDVAGSLGVQKRIIFKNTAGVISTTRMQTLALGDSETGDILINSNGKLGLMTSKIVDTITSGGSISPVKNNSFNLGSITNKWATVYTNELVTGEEGFGAFWQRRSGILSPSNTTDTVVLGSTTVQNATIALSSKKDSSSWITSGAFGIGTTTPHYQLSALGSTSNSSIVSLSNISNTNNSSANVLRLNLGSTNGNGSFIDFYSNATADNNGQKVGSISMENGNLTFKTSGADFAEYMDIMGTAEPGDIISTSRAGNKKSYTGEQILGVVTDVAGFIGNVNNKATLDNQAIVGLLGQIDTNVTTINGPLFMGAPITSSELPGFGMTATEPSTIVGTVMLSEQEISGRMDNKLCPPEFKSKKDRFGNPVLCGRVRVFVSPQYFAGVPEQKSNQTADTTEGLSLPAQIMHSLTNVVVGSFQAVQIETQRLTAASINALYARVDRLEAERIVSPVIETESIKTTDITAKRIGATEDELVIDLQKKESSDSAEPTGFAELMIQGINGETVASVDASGNATFSGELEAERITTTDITAAKLEAYSLQAQEATVAGKLTAKELDSENIRSLEQNVSSLQSRVQETQQSMRSAEDISSQVQTIEEELKKLQKTTSVESPGSALKNIPQIPEGSTSATILPRLFVSEKATAQEMIISNTFTVGSQVLRENSLAVMAEDFFISSLARIQFFEGSTIITNTGNIVTKGSITALEGIQTNTITAATEGEDIAIVLGDSTRNQRLQFVHNNKAVAGVNADGSAEFSGLALQRASSVSAELVPAEDGTQEVSIDVGDATAGSGMMFSGTRVTRIYASRVNKDSLIYLTPVTGSAIALSVGTLVTCTDEEIQIGTCKSYFSVITELPVPQDMQFNWLIIN